MSVATLRALIVDDERAARRYLAELLAEVGGVAIAGSCATTDEADHVLAAGGVDVVFVDIHLAADPARSGLAWLARRAAAAAAGAPRDPAIILATAHEGHALAAYELGVVDYLVKPWTRERVASAIERVRPRAAGVAAAARPPARLVARRGRALRLVPIADALAFQVEARLSYVHTREGRFDVDLSLAAVEASFPGELLRVHRNWLVRAARVTELSQTVAGLELSLEGEGHALRVPVATERARAVRAALLDGALGARRG
jgi:DNA-binding LytR/AlgR family response regulator